MQTNLKDYIFEKLFISKDTKVQDTDYIIEQILNCLNWFVKNIRNYSSYPDLVRRWVEKNDITDVHLYIPNEQTSTFMDSEFKNIDKYNFWWHNVEFTSSFDGMLNSLERSNKEFEKQMEIQLGSHIYTTISQCHTALYIYIRFKNTGTMTLNTPLEFLFSTEEL